MDYFATIIDQENIERKMEIDRNKAKSLVGR